jgi:hypothetical protein
MGTPGRWFGGGLVLVGLVAFVAACDGGQGTVCDCEPSIAFTSPTGGLLTEFHDQDLAELGIQVPVGVRTRCIPAGTRLLFQNARYPAEQIEGRVVLEDPATGSGRVDFGLQTFVEGSNPVCVRGSAEVQWMSDGAQGCSARLVDEVESCKSVLVQLGVPACRFERPLDGVTLTASDDASEAPGLQHPVEVACKGVADGELLEFGVRGGALLSARLAGGRVVFSEVSLPEGVNLLAAEVNDPDGNRVRAEITVIVDLGGCAVWLEPADGTVFRAADDLDPLADGLQVGIRVRTDPEGSFACPAGAPVVLRVGEQTVEGRLEGGLADLRVTLADGEYLAFAVVGAAPGKQGRSLDHRYQVCATPVSVSLEAPAAGVLVTDAADRDPASMGIQVSVTGRSAGVLLPEELWVEVDGQVVRQGGVPLRPVGFEPDGAFEFRHVTFLQSREYTVQVKGRNGCDEEAASALHRVPVISEQLTCQIVVPQDGAVLNLSDDKNGDPTDGLQLDVQVVTANVPDGQTFSLNIGGQATLTGLPVAGNAWIGEVSLQDGAGKTLWCELATGQVSPVITVTVDTMAPTVEILSPQDGVVLDVLDVVVAGATTDAAGQLVTLEVSDGLRTESFAGPVQADGTFAVPVVLFDGLLTVTASLSDVNGNPGSDQIALTVRQCPAAPGLAFLEPDETQSQPILIPAAGDATVLLLALHVIDAQRIQLVYQSHGVEVWQGQPSAFSLGEAEFLVPLVNGPGRLLASASNSCGSTVDHAVDLFVGPQDAPSMVLTAPPNPTYQTGTDLQVAAQTANALGPCRFCLRAYDPGPVPECTSAAAFAEGELLAGACGATTTLPGEGDHQVWGSVDGDFGQVATSPAVRVVVDQTPPVVAIAEPVDGQCLGALLPDADPATPGFQFRMTVSADVEDGQPVEILGAVQVGQATFAAGLARPVVTLPDGAATLTARACDRAGQCADSTAVGVFVDRTAPQVLVVNPPDGAILGAASDVSAASGFQFNVRCNFTGAQVGDTVVLARNVADGGWEDLGSRVLSASQLGSYTFPSATLLPSGLTEAPVEVRCTLSDACQSAAHVANVYINLTAPEVLISRPIAGSDLNLFSDMCAPAGLQTQVDIQTLGTQNGDVLALCQCAGPCPAPNPGSPDRCAQQGYGVTVWTGVVAGATTVVSCLPFPEGNVTLHAYAEPLGLPGQGTYSNPVAVRVDSVPPTVDSLTIVNDADGNGCLRQAEGALQLLVQASDQGLGGLEGQTARLMRDWPPGAQLATGTLTGGALTFNASLAEGTYSLTVTLTDGFGNPNIRASNPVVDDPEAWLLLDVDATPPSLALTVPGKDVYNKADDTIDPLTEALELELRVSTSAQDGQVVTFGPGGGTAQVAAGVASRVETFGQGSVTVTADVADACGNPAAQASRTILVDTLAPTLACSTPPDGFSSMQQAVAFQCHTAGITTAQLITVTSTVGGQRCQVPVDLDGTTDFSCNLAPGLAQTLTVATRDLAGNPATDTISNVSVTLQGCDLTLVGLVNPELWNRSHDADGNPTNGLQRTLTACSALCNASSCPACRIGLSVGGVSTGPAEAPDGAGCASFAVSIAHGAADVLLEASIDDAQGHVTVDQVTVELVDLVPPSLVRVRPGAASVTCAASAGNLYLDNPNQTPPANYLRDKLAGAPCDLDFEFTVSDDQIANGFEASLTLERGGAPYLGPSLVYASPENVIYPNAQLAHDATHALIARVRDYAGNEVSLDLTVVADVVPPAAVTVSAALGAGPAASRHADVAVGWTASGDDGTAGAPAGYRVRWSRAAIDSEARWYYNGAVWPNPVAEVYSGPATSAALILPPLNTYHLAVRAVDEVGNLGPIASPAPVGNMWNEVVHLGGLGGRFGYSIRNVGDVNNDGRDDLLVAEPTYLTSVGRAWMFMGAADLADWSLGGTPLPLLRGVANEYFGTFVQKIGDIDGDGFDDVAVGGYGFESFRGRLSVYFGRSDFITNPPVAPDLELRGPSASTGRYGFSYAGVGDVNGDGYEDIFVSAYQLDGNGRGYIFFGRPRSAVDPAHPELNYWFDDVHVRTGVESGQRFVPTSVAEVSFLGVDADDRFGARFGNTGLGDLDGDGYADIALSASRVNEVYTFDGSTIVGVVGDVTPGNSAHVVDILTYGTTINNGGFGQFAKGAIDVTNDGILDLLVSSAFANQVYLFRGRVTGGSPSVAIDPTYVRRLTWGEDIAFGTIIDAGDLNLDGWPDLTVGCNASGGHRLFLYFNNRTSSGSTPYFGASPGAILGGAAGSYFGIDLAIGDFDGNGLPDLAVGSSYAGSATDPGRLSVWY